MNPVFWLLLLIAVKAVWFAVLGLFIPIGAGINTISQWVKKYNETGDLSNKPLKRGFKKIDLEKLVLFLEEKPDAFLKETAEESGCSIEAVRKAIKRLGITRKKRHCVIMGKKKNR